ncbi:P-selectin glycoprotein ligand 1-like [Acipenser oxyrinchus oxyrinchus]|uniref:P-selectin glycoprotein ligand 1-like n=1 Tax=Acipenser oxyrinchus oxyrinchus TaxID=40147 RepID=A0AAD8D2W3_ACIOX|nr:P-selectin glycoprotein ligand 1-like [Acipenser oxyrinchus oxyrinchus]
MACVWLTLVVFALLPQALFQTLTGTSVSTDTPQTRGTKDPGTAVEAESPIIPKIRTETKDTKPQSTVSSSITQNISTTQPDDDSTMDSEETTTTVDATEEPTTDSPEPHSTVSSSITQNISTTQPDDDSTMDPDETTVDATEELTTDSPEPHSTVSSSITQKTTPTVASTTTESPQSSTARTDNATNSNASFAIFNGTGTITPYTDDTETSDSSEYDTTETTEPPASSAHFSTTSQSNSTNSSGVVLILKKDTTTRTSLTTVAGEGSSTGTTTQANQGREFPCSTAFPRKGGLVSHCLIAIAVLAAVATIFIICTIVLCTKLSSTKQKYMMRECQGTEMMCISALLSDAEALPRNKAKSSKSNGRLITNVEDSEGDDLTLHSFLQP